MCCCVELSAHVREQFSLMFDVVGNLEAKVDKLIKHLGDEEVTEEEDVVGDKDVADEEDSVLGKDVDEAQPVKRGRGRPSKNKTASTTVSTTKRGPGRPPKDKASSTTLTTTKRGRGRPRKNVVGEAKPMVYHSFHPLHQVCDETVKEFKSWYDDCNTNLKSGVVYTNLARYSMLSIDWMNDIQRGRCGITSHHCDVILGLLIYKAKMKPDLFLPRWTVMDSFAWSVLSEGDESWHRTIADYVSGKRPEDRRMPWEQVDKIYGIGWLDKNHFVAYCIDVLQRNTMVFDSISGGKRWPNVREKFRLFSTRISLIFQKLRGKGCQLSDHIRPWNVVEAVDAPQQSNLCDCGIISLKVIESLVVGTPFLALDSESCRRHRRNYCIDLYRLSSVADG